MIGQQLQIHGWETRFRDLDKTIKLNPTVIPTEIEREKLDDIITNDNIQLIKAARIAWKQWKDAKKEADSEIKLNKTEYLENILKDAQQATNANLTGAVWKSINKLSRYKPKNNTALQTKTGTWCTTAQEELETIKEHLQTDYNTTDNPNKGVETDNSWFNPKEINWVHYRGAIMQVKVNKAVPSWSAPTAAYHITSSIIAKYMTKDIHNIILTQEYPKIWRDIQTVWIEKPDKDPSIIHNRRPINLEEPGFKAYLNTLQE
jgi:hypothetical protein